MRPDGSDGIRIHAQNFYAGEQLVQLLDNILCAAAVIFQLSPAVGAQGIHPLGIAAIVADQPPVAAVIRQRYAAARAAVGITAADAADELVRTAPVNKQNALLSPVDIPLQFFAERLADIARIAAAKLTLHVDNTNLRQRHVVIAFWKCKEGISACFRIIAAGNIRRCRAEQQQAARTGTEIFCHIARVVTRRILGFIALLLLLVDNQQPKIVNRRKHRAARADHELCTSASDALPLVIAFSDGETGVQHGDLIAEV